MEVPLINEELLKRNSPIKEDTVITKFIPYINLAQQLYIERILGTPLTEELQLQILEAGKPDGEEIAPDNQALILKIAPALSFYTVYQGLPYHWASIQNKGITIRESENSKGIDINDLSQLRRWIKDDAEVLTRNLIDYLSSCKCLYHLWQPEKGCGCNSLYGDGRGAAAVQPDYNIYVPLSKRRR